MVNIYEKKLLEIDEKLQIEEGMKRTKNEKAWKHLNLKKFRKASIG